MKFALSGTALLAALGFAASAQAQEQIVTIGHSGPLSGPNAYAASYYDQTMLIGSAMQKADSVDPKKVGDQIYSSSHKGVAGTYAYDAKGNLKQAPITVSTLRNAAPVPLAHY